MNFTFYVTFTELSWLYGSRRFAVECKSRESMLMIADNAKSLAVFHNVKTNTTGRFNSKPCKIISENEYMQGFDYLN
ncbi:hypothetical protein [Segatella copri]|uniref:hypothetical protein n=1 Tax=Segatella copri TaxID=165179 RepID=UPI001C490B11|nr:hypothetical protein [Segatella copri]MBW0025548.1 hypothetical protein [Segatella copri]